MAAPAYAKLDKPPTLKADPVILDEQRPESEGMTTLATDPAASASAKAIAYGARPPEAAGEDVAQAAQAALVRVKSALVADEQQWMQGTLSKGTAYRLTGTGEMTAKDLGKLIKLLEAQKAVLVDDED